VIVSMIKGRNNKSFGKAKGIEVKKGGDICEICRNRIYCN
jgi:DNA-binding protein